MDNKAPTNSGKISSNVPTTGKKVKNMEKSEHLQWNELKSELTVS